ncbi:MAG: GHKL domain-containing protein [Lachnospiraceae bacterium]|nr:GHKL domain-containing protein [Lachnospiraceae bacterium]
MMEYLTSSFEAYAESYLAVLIELYLIMDVLLLIYWLKPFVDTKKAVYASAVVYYAHWLISSHADTSKEMDRILTILFLVLAIVAAWLLDNKRNPVQKIFLFFIFRLISWLSIELLSEIGFWERDFLFGFDWYRSNLEAVVTEFLIWNPMQYALALLILYLVIRILHKTYRYKRDELTWQEFILLLAPAWTLLLVKPIISSYYLLWMDGMKNGSIKENLPANPYRALFCLFAFVPVVTVISLYQKLKEKQEEEYVRDSVEKQVGDMSGHVTHIEEIYERMRGLRHDLGNHLTVIERLAEDGKTEELADYIKELGDNTSRLQPKVKTGNAVTDVVLSETADRCEREGIIFESSFAYPEGLDINPFDLSVVLTNALQNALEASSRVPFPKIMIRSLQNERVFIINIKNIMSEKVSIMEDGLPVTQKHESGHGYGLKNIRSIAAKYSGDIEIRQEEQEGDLYFIINIMLIGQ